MDNRPRDYRHSFGRPFEGYITNLWGEPILFSKIWSWHTHQRIWTAFWAPIRKGQILSNRTKMTSKEAIHVLQQTTTRVCYANLVENNDENLKNDLEPKNTKPIADEYTIVSSSTALQMIVSRKYKTWTSERLQKVTKPNWQDEVKYQMTTHNIVLVYK